MTKKFVHTEWDYSHEGIRYGLNKGARDFLGLNEAIVVEALSKLPCEIIDFALEYLFFFSSDVSQYMPLREIDRWKAIIFIEPNLHKKGKTQQMFSIAHEIAHAKLEHSFLLTPEKNEEDKANRLATKWLAEYM